MKIQDSLYWEIKKNYSKEFQYKIRDYHEGSYNELLPIYIFINKKHNINTEKYINMNFCIF